MDKISVQSNGPINGSASIAGDKICANHALVGAAVLESPVKINNVCTTSDAESIIGWLERKRRIDIGGNYLSIEGGDVNSSEYESVFHIRSSICIATAYLLRHGSLVIPKEIGGCSFTTRGIDRHLACMEAFGGKISDSLSKLYIKLDRVPDTVVFDCGTKRFGPSVGVTCHALLSAIYYTNKIVLHNFAKEPSVETVLQLVQAATKRQIDEAEDEIVIHSTKKLEHDAVNITLPPDINAAATYLAMAMNTRGKVKLLNISAFPDSVTSLLQTSRIDIDSSDDNLECGAEKTAHFGPIKCTPWPGIPSDIGPILAAAVCAIPGKSQVTDSVYDTRSSHVFGLNKMGYDLSASANSVFIRGKDASNNKINVESTDIRAGAALLVGAVARDGLTNIAGYHQLMRGYPDLLENLKKLNIQFTTDK